MIYFVISLQINFIVCANKKAVLPQFQDEMIRFSSRYLTRNKVI